MTKMKTVSPLLMEESENQLPYVHWKPWLEFPLRKIETNGLRKSDSLKKIATKISNPSMLDSLKEILLISREEPLLLKKKKLKPLPLPLMPLLDPPMML
jgi:hypothetical protein